MKLVIDCNVLIAAAITDGTCRKFVLEAIKRHQICICEEILSEIREVISRPKFKKYHSRLLEILELLLVDAKLVVIKKNKKFFLPDIDDEIYLACPLDAGCDYLVTGNSKDFLKKKWGDLEIISPRDFLNI